MPFWLLSGIACLSNGGTDPTATDSDTVPTATDSDTAAHSDLVEHGVIHCENPEERQELGPLVLAQPSPDWEAQALSGHPEWTHGVGVAVEDFDLDGHLDILLAHKTRPMLFSGNGDGTLTLDTTALPEPASLEDSTHYKLTHVVAADFSGDGAPDLVFGSLSVGPMLWENDGSGRFSDVTQGSGLPDDGPLEMETSPFGDLDGDGDLDLYLGHDGRDVIPPDPAELDVLLLNQGDGTFEDISDRLEETWRHGYTQVVSLVDVNEDGTTDIYVTNHRHSLEGNRLLQGVDGAYVDAEELGLNVALESMGTGLGDINNDGVMDFLLSGEGEMKLLESLPDGTWHETTRTRGLTLDPESDQVVAWGNHLADLDNDGDLDAWVVFGHANKHIQGRNPDEQPDGLWLREGSEFESVGPTWGVDHTGSSRGLVVFDQNGDGWLDGLTTRWEAPAELLLSRCGEAAWLVVDLFQPPPNPRAIGARVRLQVGDQKWVRWVTGASTGYESSPPPQIHFGLGDAEKVDSLVVTWPDGSYSEHRGISVRQHVEVRREEF